MILLDTDHVTLLQFPENPRCEALAERLDAAEDDDVALTVITVEEQMRGWLAKINQAKFPEEQIHPYERLEYLIGFFSQWRIQPHDGLTVGEFKDLKQQKINIGTQDLKIAAIAISHNALLLSANLKDFQKVPGLRVENWLE